MTVAVDPMVVLERIHADVRLLRELAGDALVITIAPAPTNGNAPVRTHGGGRGHGASPATRDLVVRAKEILAAAGEPMAVADLRDRLDLTIKGFAKVRALLNDDPQVYASGSTRSRRYELRPDAPTPSRRQRIAVEAAGSGNAKGMFAKGARGARQQPYLAGQIMSIIQLIPRTASEIAQHLSTPLDEVMPQLRRLEADGDVERREPSGRWAAIL